jgi:hypothetical protein
MSGIAPSARFRSLVSVTMQIGFWIAVIGAPTVSQTMPVISLPAAPTPVPYALDASVTVRNTLDQPRRKDLDPVLYAIQALDAARTDAGIRHCRMKESNPLMRPFAHGGFLMLESAFAIGDLIRWRLLRHASAGTRRELDEVQIGTNAEGILQTASVVCQGSDDA